MTTGEKIGLGIGFTAVGTGIFLALRQGRAPTLLGEGPKAQLVRKANAAGRASRRGGAPHLSVNSSREQLTHWLQWNDPNGVHTDDLAALENMDPYTKTEAWKAVLEALRDDWAFDGAKRCARIPTDALATVARVCERWHSGQSSGCYSVLSLYTAGKKIPNRSLQRAIDELSSVFESPTNDMTSEETEAVMIVERSIAGCR